MENEEKSKTKQLNNIEQNQQTVRVHRIGTITFGVSLLAMGTLFLLHMFLPVITYQTVYRLWPVIFILLGIEILISNQKEKSNKQKNEDVYENNDIENLQIEKEYLEIYNLILYKPINIQQLVKKSGLNISKLNQKLTILELEGHIKNLPGNNYVRV